MELFINISMCFSLLVKVYTYSQFFLSDIKHIITYIKAVIKDIKTVLAKQMYRKIFLSVNNEKFKVNNVNSIFPASIIASCCIVFIIGKCMVLTGQKGALSHKQPIPLATPPNWCWHTKTIHSYFSNCTSLNI